MPEYHWGARPPGPAPQKTPASPHASAGERRTGQQRPPATAPAARWQGRADRRPRPHSHSIVPGGFDVTSYSTRLRPGTRLTIVAATAADNSDGNRQTPAVRTPRPHAAGRGRPARRSAGRPRPRAPAAPSRRCRRRPTARRSPAPGPPAPGCARPRPTGSGRPFRFPPGRPPPGQTGGAAGNRPACARPPDETAPRSTGGDRRRWPQTATRRSGPPPRKPGGTASTRSP